MTRQNARSFFLCVLILAGSVAAPWVIWERAQTEFREQGEALRRQHLRLSELAAENRHLTNLLVQAWEPLSSAERHELMRLRSEAGQLRECAKQIERVREENRQRHAQLAILQHYQRFSQAELDEELADETFDAMQKIIRELPPALENFAKDHTNRPPTNLLQLKNYLASSSRSGTGAGLYALEFATSHPMDVPVDSFLLRERDTHKNADGKWARFYAFGDGHIVEAAPDDDNFDAWEKAHTGHSP